VSESHERVYIGSILRVNYMDSLLSESCVDVKDARGGLLPSSSGSLSLPPVAAPRGCFPSLATCVVCGSLPRQHLSLVCARCEDLESILDGTPVIGASGFDRIPPELMVLRDEVLDLAWQQRLNGNYEPWLDFLNEAYSGVADDNSGCHHDGFLVGVETNPGPGPYKERKKKVYRAVNRQSAAELKVNLSASDEAAMRDGSLDAKQEALDEKYDKVPQLPGGPRPVFEPPPVPEADWNGNGLEECDDASFYVPIRVRTEFPVVWWLLSMLALSLTVLTWWGLVGLVLNPMVVGLAALWLQLRLAPRVLPVGTIRQELQAVRGMSVQPVMHDLLGPFLVACTWMLCASGWSRLTVIGYHSSRKSFKVLSRGDQRIVSCAATKLSKRDAVLQTFNTVNYLTAWVSVGIVERETVAAVTSTALPRARPEVQRQLPQWIMQCKVVNVPSSFDTSVSFGCQRLIQTIYDVGYDNQEFLTSEPENFWLSPVVAFGGMVIVSVMSIFLLNLLVRMLGSQYATILSNCGALFRWLSDQGQWESPHPWRTQTMSPLQSMDALVDLLHSTRPRIASC